MDCGQKNKNINKIPCGCVPFQEKEVLSTKYFNVDNTFDELKTKKQKADARKNLEIQEIINFEQTKESTESGDSNIWTMYTSQGDSKKVYNFKVYNGKDGKDGKEGTAPEIVNGYWVINGKSTNVPALGKDGETPRIGEDGYWYIGDQKTDVKAQGKDGKNGTNGTNGSKGDKGDKGDSPEIRNGYWYVGNVNTGVKAKGEDGANGTNGAQGVGISTIKEFFKASNAPYGESSNSGTWTQQIPELNSNKKYLWRYVLTELTNGTVQKTLPNIINTFVSGGQGGSVDEGVIEEIQEQIDNITNRINNFETVKSDGYYTIKVNELSNILNSNGFFDIKPLYNIVRNGNEEEFYVTRGVIQKVAFDDATDALLQSTYGDAPRTKHYTDDQYKVMYYNALAISKAIQYAYETGYAGVILPRGEYSFCAINSGVSNDIKNCILVMHVKNFDINLNGSTLNFLVDSRALYLNPWIDLRDESKGRCTGNLYFQFYDSLTAAVVDFCTAIHNYYNSTNLSEEQLEAKNILKFFGWVPGCSALDNPRFVFKLADKSSASASNPTVEAEKAKLPTAINDAKDLIQDNTSPAWTTADWTLIDNELDKLTTLFNNNSVKFEVAALNTLKKICMYVGQRMLYLGKYYPTFWMNTKESGDSDDATDADVVWMTNSAQRHPYYISANSAYIVLDNLYTSSGILKKKYAELDENGDYIKENGEIVATETIQNYFAKYGKDIKYYTLSGLRGEAYLRLSHAGTLIGIRHCDNVSLHDGVLRGDRHFRDWSFFPEQLRNQENTAAVSLSGAFTNNIHLYNLVISGFAADAISNTPKSSSYYREPIWFGDWVTESLEKNNIKKKIIPTNIIPNNVYLVHTRSDKPVNTRLGFYPYKYVSTSSTRWEATKLDVSNDENKVLLTGYIELKTYTPENEQYVPDYFKDKLNDRIFSVYGYSRVVHAYTPMLEIITFAGGTHDDINNPPLRKITVTSYDQFKLYPNEKYIRVQLLREKKSDFSSNITFTTSNNVDYPGEGLVRFLVVPKLNLNLTLTDCVIRDNGRGAFVGGFNDVLVDRCIFDKRGSRHRNLAAGGEPTYIGDGTNYHFDFEEYFSGGLVVRNSYFTGTPHTGAFFVPYVYKLRFENNVIYRCTPGSGNCIDAVFRNNRYFDTGFPLCSRDYTMFGSKSWSKYNHKSIIYDSNFYYGVKPHMIGNGSSNTTIKVVNCSFYFNDNTTAVDSSVKIVNHSKHDITFINCNFEAKKISTPDKSPNTGFLGKLENCYIKGGHWTVIGLNNCTCEDASFKILHLDTSTNETDKIISSSINNVSGIDLNTFWYNNKLDQKYTVIILVNNCDIKLDLTAEYLGSSQVKEIYVVYNNCIFRPGTCDYDSQTTYFNRATQPHHYIFNNCDFMLFKSQDYIFGGSFINGTRGAGSLRKVSMLFNNCLMPEGIKLDKGTNSNIICYSTQGPTNKKPYFVPYGFAYYDTDELKMFYRIKNTTDDDNIWGTQPLWVDALGNS